MSYGFLLHDRKSVFFAFFKYVIPISYTSLTVIAPKSYSFIHEIAEDASELEVTLTGSWYFRINCFQVLKPTMG
jgi:hypothetical protein